MSDDDSERRVLSRKELAKEQRKAAYQKAKERRASDPRHLAMNEAVKAQRRADYQKAKASRKTVASEAKASRKASASEAKANRKVAAAKEQLAATRSPEPTAQRLEKNEALAALAGWMSKGSTAKN